MTVEQLARRFPRIERWESGELLPTLRQVEGLAKATHTPVGYMFLPEPPIEDIPIPDFRTAGNAHLGHPSPDLLEMVYVCQQRQEWYRDAARSQGSEPLPFVGAATLNSGVDETATEIRHALQFDIQERRQIPTWTEALRRFINQADDFGILVMCSGVVLSNNRRTLNPDEFRGFALADDLAPLIFINGSDTKAGQMFTLAHEVAHIWLGQSALSDTQPERMPHHNVERWCNRVAAELLAPLTMFKDVYNSKADIDVEINRLARMFKVSTLVIIRRIYDSGGLSRRQLSEVYEEELERLLGLSKGKGGNFYLTQAARVSKRFARALVISTLEGRTLYRDAFRMLGFSKVETFRRLGRSLGVDT